MFISKIKNLSGAPMHIELKEYVTSVQTGVTKEVISKIRKEKNKEKKTKLKTSLPAVIFGGIFKGNRQKESLVEKTGLIGLDIDGLDISELNTIRKTLENDKYSNIVNLSAGAGGFCVVMKYKVTNDFTQTFLAI